ncbi:hypothetical protein ACQ4PT_048406 [Festuca glaucescens]
MLRLRSCILTRLLSSPATSPVPPLHRLLSAAAPAASPSPSFAVEDYLVATCGLTRAQALKASTKLSHLKSPTKPDAVLAILAGLGLSRADIAAVVAKDPKFLCTSVETTLASTVIDLTGISLSHTEIARLVSLAPFSFRSRSIGSNLPYFFFPKQSPTGIEFSLSRDNENTTLEFVSGLLFTYRTATPKDKNQLKTVFHPTV